MYPVSMIDNNFWLGFIICRVTFPKLFVHYQILIEENTHTKCVLNPVFDKTENRQNHFPECTKSSLNLRQI